MSAFDLDGYLKERRALVDAALERFLPGEDTPPPTVHRAMRYSVMAGGKRLRPILEIADAAGTGGMVAGQVVDIESEGKTITPETLEFIHTRKTAALIRASLSVGARLGGGDAAALAAIADAGQSLGLAFQIVDDILDVEGSLEALGKTAGSDERKQKATYPALHGIEASRREARRLIEETKSRLAVFGGRSAPLCALADYVVERKS